MEIFKIVAVGVVSAVLIVYLKHLNSELTMPLTVCCGILILLMTVSYVEEFLSVFSNIASISGIDGSVLKIAKKMGLTISPLFPALTSFKVNPKSVQPLKGIRTTGTVTLLSDGKKLGKECGEIQFGDGTISGICVFNLSCLASGKEKLRLSIDMLPDTNYNDAKELIRNIKIIRKNAPLEDFLSGIINKRIGIAIIKSVTAHTLTENVSVLNDKELSTITEKIKNFSFEITGLSGFEKSQVTAGGIHINEVDSSFRSKKIKGLYFCGEILDIIGDCGGYNLFFAFGSGAMVGKVCAEDLDGKN